MVDDSPTVRAVFARLIEGEPDLRLAASAESAEGALATLVQAAPDVILLDLDMPGMGGLEAIPRMLELAAPVRILVVSSLTVRGAEHTLAALSLGAADTLAKPLPGRFDQDYRATLLRKIRLLGRVAKRARLKTPPAALPQLRPHAKEVPHVLAIGASTGGIHALGQLLGALPARFDVPILITQHLPGSFIGAFVRQLRAASGRETEVAEERTVIRPGRIVVAPGDAHMTVVASANGDTVRASVRRSGPQRLPAVGRPDARQLCRGLRQPRARRGLVGHGARRHRGRRAPRRRGRNDHGAGRRERGGLGHAGRGRRRRPRLGHSPARADSRADRRDGRRRMIDHGKPASGKPELGKIDQGTIALGIVAGLLEARTGQKLTADRAWRVGTALSGVMRAHAIESLEDLAARLGKPNQGELAQQVVEALLNNETYFFRDRAMFDLLSRTILPELAARREDTRRLSIWSVGCSTGQEAYSLAMLFAEQRTRWRDWTIDILGTDVARSVVAAARDGNYSQFQIQRGLGVAQMVSFFEENRTGWRACDMLRTMVRFETHNLLDVPPDPGRFDLILCRNVLLYFDRPTARARSSGWPARWRAMGASCSGRARPRSARPNCCCRKRARPGSTIWRSAPAHGAPDWLQQGKPRVTET